MQESPKLKPIYGVGFYFALFFVWMLYVPFVYPSIKSLPQPVSTLSIEFFRALFFAVPVIIISYKVLDNPLKELGITRNVLKGLIIGILFAGFWFLISISTEVYIKNKVLTPSEIPLAFWLTGFTFSTFIEELAFRSFLLQTLESLGKYAAIILSALAFVAIHFPGWILLDIMPDNKSFAAASMAIFILGLVLAVIFLKTRSIWSVVVIHAFNNLAAVLISNSQ